MKRMAQVALLMLVVTGCGAAEAELRRAEESYEQARYELFVTLRNLFDRQLQLPEVANYTPTQVVNGGDRFNVLAGIRFRL